VDSGHEKEELMNELITRLEDVRDVDGRKVVRKVHRTNNIYSGPALAYAPDLIVGYHRDFRASWQTCLGDMNEEILSDNNSAWSADHCMDASELPGVLYSNRPLATNDPSLVDLGPSILSGFGLAVPSNMEGKNIFKSRG